MPDLSVGHLGASGPVGPADRVPPSSFGDPGLGPRSIDSDAPTFAEARLIEPTPRAPAPAPARPGDRVDLSEHARYLDRIRRLPPARSDRVDQVRAEIARGEYETEEKITATIDRLLEELAG